MLFKVGVGVIDIFETGRTVRLLLTEISETVNFYDASTERLFYTAFLLINSAYGTQ